MDTYTPKTKEWFMDRIGKKIYRDSQCIKDKEHCCASCKDVFDNGLIVRDESHADYLAMIDMDFGAEGIYSNYRDAK
jgi:hypothetical protein